MNKERLSSFVDAVLAIVMTILVLELEKPAEPTIQAFLSLKEGFISYILSFSGWTLCGWNFIRNGMASIKFLMP